MNANPRCPQQPLLDHGLILAAMYGHAAEAESLLRRGADVNTRDRSGRTPLMIAALFGYEATVQVLLKFGADVAARSDRSAVTLRFPRAGLLRDCYDGFSVVRYAVLGGRSRIVNLIMAHAGG